jgi:hypothetical protein
MLPGTVLMHATSGWPKSVEQAPHEGVGDSGLFTANNTEDAP